MVYSVSFSQSKFDLLKCGTQLGHVSNRSGTFKVANLRATLSTTTHLRLPTLSLSLPYHSECHVHVLQRFTTNYWVLSEPHIASRGGEACRVAQSLSAYMDLGLLAAMLRMWMVDCGRLRMCGCHRLTVPLFLAVRPVALLMWRCNWTGKLHISSYFYAEFNGRREAGTATAVAAAAARRPGEAKRTFNCLWSAMK